MWDGPLLTAWTIRAALLCYAAVVAALLLNWNHRTLLRLFWTAGCVLFFAHLASAMHFYHQWSNQHAIADTARQTRELLGFEFGNGLYFSYLFGLLWLADVLWWWIFPVRYETRPLWSALLIHGYLLFIAFNGAVVFEAGMTRPAGIAAMLLFLLLAMLRFVAPRL